MAAWLDSMHMLNNYSLLLILLLLIQAGCAAPADQAAQPPLPLSGINSPALPPEKAEELASQVGRQWFFGEGVGNTVATVGTVVLFPPYAALVLGNAALSMGGYEQYWLSDVLPEEERGEYRLFYRNVTSLPGRTHAAIAGRDFITNEEAALENEQFLRNHTSESGAGTGIAAD